MARPLAQPSRRAPGSAWR